MSVSAMPIPASTASSALSAMLSSGDILGALMLVQTERTKLLDKQLADRIQDVRAKNEATAALNTAMAKVNIVLNAFPKNSEADATIEDWDANKVNTLEKPLNDALKAVGLLNFGSGPELGGRTGDGSIAVGKSVFAGGRTQHDVKQLQNEIQGKLDNMNSTSQMDMMGLQSLSNKRNEAFELMTNFMKKVQDGISAILSNLR
ncbi:hypothetical protein ACI0FO_16915 [Achromobacter marplatensis]